ncbi:hypothetical protein OPS25_10520 [Alteromonas ponticola]|uniref:Uncharacterized protein n=1 Tax=Alteromonas aquimaris TaxID=2998417 RepID=A0ABT3P825_9ALTE|nr:hypothetical protein [Alteromonas aquimaris]MCW8108926.1 hypothetical protein [Alteromonas aquimaris]
MTSPINQSDRFINIDIKTSTLVDILASHNVHICDLHCARPTDKKLLQRLLLQATSNTIRQL